MARADLAHPKNAAGTWFVDTRCIRCDAARNWAPDLIDMDSDGRSFVAYQPVGEEQEAALWRAAAGCPTRSIGNHQQPREPGGVFPYQMTQGVFALGNNALSSFGAHSYLVVRPDGNMMIDSPRFSRPLAAHVDELGGVAHVLLTHRDDVADAARWAERYGARVWIGDADSDAAPYATDVTVGIQPTVISPGALSVPAPGHTEGHVMYHVDDRLLFTGDTLHWNHRRGEFDVFPEQTFYSWTALLATIDRIASLSVEWVFPGHGMWCRVDMEEWRQRMSALGQAMRRVRQAGWAALPNAAYGWY